jgi:predicted membrane chloride channel (bestrophin family)
VERGEVVLCAFALLLIALGLLVIAGASFIAVEVYERYFEGCRGWG